MLDVAKPNPRKRFDGEAFPYPEAPSIASLPTGSGVRRLRQIFEGLLPRRRGTGMPVRDPEAYVLMCRYVAVLQCGSDSGVAVPEARLPTIAFTHVWRCSG